MLRQFADDVGIFYRLRSDLAPEITVKHTEFQAQVNRLRIDLTHSKVKRYNHNHAAEGDIGYINKLFWKKMLCKKVHKRLWYCGLVHQDGILSRINCGKTRWSGVEEVTRRMLDIS